MFVTHVYNFKFMFLIVLSNVIVLVEAGGKLYSATKEVKVTVGGCGG